MCGRPDVARVIVRAWRLLRPLLPPGARRDGAVFTVESFVAGVVEAGLTVAVVALSMAIVDGRDDLELDVPGLSSHTTSVGMVTAAAAAGTLLVLVLHWHASVVAARLPAGVLRTARERAISAYARAEWAQQETAREGALQETVGGIAVQSATLVMHLATFVYAAVALMALGIAAVLVDPVITGCVILLGAILSLALRPIGALTRKRAEEFVSDNNTWTESTSEWASIAFELRAFGVDERRASNLIGQNRRVCDSMRRSQLTTRGGAALFRDLALLMLVAGVATIYWIDLNDVTSVGAVVLLVVRSLSYAQVANYAQQTVNELAPNLELLNSRIDAFSAHARTRGNVKATDIGVITLSDAGYRYPANGGGISGVDLTIRAGEAIGVIGKSGSGKTTLMQLLLGLRSPTTGSIQVDGVDLSRIDSASWHRLVAVVPQEPRLVEGTVAENIAFFRNIDKAQVKSAANASHLSSDTLRLADGLRTRLGPRGAGLSGGQRQRVAIARALAGEPKLLVLDEPTSALDVQAEEVIKRTIEALKGHVTMVIVAHRLTTLACCDRVAVMNDGRLEFVGSLEDAIRVAATDNDVLTDDEPAFAASAD